MVVLTGDMHGLTGRIYEFCAEHETTVDDVMIVLGDAGINYWGDSADEGKKRTLAAMDITFFCIHGNHEERPENISSYIEKEWRGGIVMYEEAFPNILFAKDGEIYDFDGKKAIAIGGAYSVDKYYRIATGQKWFSDEQPDDYTKDYVERQLDKADWKVDFVLSHTVPFSYMPTHAFLPTIDQSTVDQSTEEWLDTIEQKLDYEKWYAGHYHITWDMDRVQILFEDYEEMDLEY